MLGLIAAQKVIATVAAVVVVGGGTAAGVVVTNPTGGTCNGGCITAVQGKASTNSGITAVLGDSYSAGEGTGGQSGKNYIPSTDKGNFSGTGSSNPLNLPGGDNCHRSNLSYAVKIFNAGIFVACSGATSGDMDSLQSNGTSYRSDGDLTQVDRLRLPHGKPNPNVKTVIISVGGDDMGFASVLAACTSQFNVGLDWGPVNFKLQVGPLAPFLGSGAAPGACQTAINQAETGANPPNYSAGFNALHANLITLYGDIHSAAPDAHIYTVGYPHIFPPNGHAGCNGIAPVDQIALNNATDALNAVIHTAASQAGNQVTFVDTTNVMNGHFICGDSDGWINDLQLTSNLKFDGHHAGPFNCKYKNVAEWQVTSPVDIGVCAQSFHPTAEGAKALGQQVQDCINDATACEPNPPPNAVAAWNATFGACEAATGTPPVTGVPLRHVADLLPRTDTTQIADLNQFAGLPLAELGEGSVSQQAEGQADLAALNKFFGTNRALTTFTGPCQSAPTTPTPPVPTQPAPGNDSPADAVNGFYQNELAGDWTRVCSFVTPDANALCIAGTLGQGAATGSVTVGQPVVSGNEALVPVTGSICAPSSQCVSNSDPTTGMPISPEDFSASYQAAVANSTSSSSTVLSPVPCTEIGGQWYVDFG